MTVKAFSFEIVVTLFMERIQIDQDFIFHITLI